MERLVYEMSRCHQESSICRRDFIRCAAATAIVPATKSIAATVSPDLVVGVLSDVHVEGSTPSAKTAAFERALAYFRDAGADAVLIAGDIADYGLVSELENVARSWYKVFPDDRLPDGRHVEKIFVYGDHDISCWHIKSVYWGGEWEGDMRARKWADAIARDPAAAWEKCFHEEFRPCFRKTVKGYDFLCAHWTAGADHRAHSDIPGAADFVLSEGARCDPAKPFFYVQHRHPKGTCFAPWVCSDGGLVTPALARFPNAVAISGHAHEPLSDERNVWQGAFTSFGTATLDYAGGRNWCENCAPFVSGTSRLAPMPRIDLSLCTQGMVMRVYPDRIDLERRDFQWGESMGPDWSIPWPPSRAKPYAPDANAARLGAPEFAPGATVSFSEVDGRTADNRPMRRVVVAFPPANAGSARVYHYEIVATFVEEDFTRPCASKLVLAPDHHLPPSRTGLPGEAHFAFAELPHNAHVRFDVTPVSCFGRRGKAISSAQIWKMPAQPKA